APGTIDIGSNDLSSAIACMEQAGVDAVHVLDGDRLAGVITYQAANAALRDGMTLESVVSHDFPTASPQARQFDLYPLAGTGLPIALTNETGRLTGVVRPQDVFRQLASGRA